MRDDGVVVRARIAAAWEYRTEEGTGGCLSPCETCVVRDGGDPANQCSTLCDEDEDCDEGRTCFGCYGVKARVKRCEETDDCNFDETCEEGLCLFST